MEYLNNRTILISGHYSVILTTAGITFTTHSTLGLYTNVKYAKVQHICYIYIASTLIGMLWFVRLGAHFLYEKPRNKFGEAAFVLTPPSLSLRLETMNLEGDQVYPTLA